MSEAKRQGSREADAFRAGPPRERTDVRDYLESIAIAVLLVLCVRQVVVEAFRIRHGSMAPTLVGDHQELRCPNCGWTFAVGADKVGSRGQVECPNCRYRWPGGGRFAAQQGRLRFRTPEWLWNTAYTSRGQVLEGTPAANRVQRGPARVFVNKFVYRLRKPRRWEVTVFLFPTYDAYCPDCDWSGEVNSLEGLKCPECGNEDLQIEARNYIKRIVGLPGERIRIRGGDVYADGAILRKPASVQEELWFHVFDSRFMPRQEVQPTWDLRGARPLWRRDPPGGVLMLDALGADEPVLAAFGRPVRDFYPYDGLSYESNLHGFSQGGRHELGDVRVWARVRVQENEPGGAVVLSVSDAGHELTYRVPTGDGAAELANNGLAVRRADTAGISPGRSHWVCLENYDDRAVARLDGRELMRFDYEGAPPGARSIRFGGKGARILWERVAIQRDIYYLSVRRGGEAEPVYSLGDEEYLVLGDNSPASSDSRLWDEPGIPEDNFIGRAFFVFWPVHHMQWFSGGAVRK